MQELDQVEAALARLMPPGLKQDFQLELEEMIDDLAGELPVAPVATASISRRGRWLAAGGMAAAVAGLCVALPSFSPSQVAAVLPHDPSSGLVLVSESGRIESMTDEGWQEDRDGFAVHAVRLNIVEENQVRDEETGMIVQISQPREELLLSPISAF